MGEERIKVEDTLWMRCLFELLPVRQQAGDKELPLTDVDALVLEKSKLPTAELLQFLGHNAELCGARSASEPTQK